MTGIFLSADVAPDGALPTELRLFHAGVNTTSKGDFLCDAAGIAAVLAAQARDGVDLMIDLEHHSVDPEARLARPDACDARGWCRLAERNGELWMVDITWTPDGAERLRAKKQRYVSPVVERDPDSHRILSVLNIALCGMPATHHAQPLVAASKRPLAGPGPACKALIAMLCKHYSSQKARKR